MERAQFEQLALEHLDAVYRMACHLTRNPETAEDLVQEVFVRALKPSAVERFEDRAKGDPSGSGGIRSWLFTICHNVFYSQTKRQRRAPSAVGEFFDQQSTELLPDEAPPAWDQASFDWEQVDDRLKGAIEGLRDDYREVLLLWGVEGFRYREIAEILGVPIGTVMSRLHRARKILAVELAEDGALRDLGYSRLVDNAADGTDGRQSSEQTE